MSAEHFSQDSFSRICEQAEVRTASPASAPASHRFLPLLVVLFMGSGCAALIYEVVWLQLLQLVIGSTAVSLGVLLGTFMGGLCLGSIALPRLVSARRHPLRVYALLELGIGVIGIFVLFGMPLVDRLYASAGGHGLAGILLRGGVCAACLLPPTLLMGATLPAVARWLEMTPKGVSWVGFFYGGNTAGAVLGCLLAGFYLLRVHDVAVATFVAAFLNGSVAFVAFSLSTLARHDSTLYSPGQGRGETSPGYWTVYIAIGLSGLCALGAEVIWTRLISLLLAGTVYSFAIILAVFLAGLGIGSGVGSYLARRVKEPRLVLGCCQILIFAAVAWTAFMIARSLPYWPVDPTLSRSPWFTFQLDLARCLWAILPATMLWGASFPLALAAVAGRKQDPGRLVGGIYAANTIGAIAGSLGFSLILISWIGTQQSQRLLIGLSVAAALLVLVPLQPRFRTNTAVRGKLQQFWLKRATAVSLAAGAAGFAVLMTWSVPGIPWELVAYGRRMPAKLGQTVPLFVREGMNSSVAVSEMKNGKRNFHVSGKVVASNDSQDMRMQKMLGHFPALFHPMPRTVLVVGCGAGVTAGTFVLHPSVERIVICEIEKSIPEVAARYFSLENNSVMADPRVEVVYDDARHYILRTREKFDIITSDPIHPWLKGSAVLYTKEYFELCRQHLNAGGVVTQWVPLYESTPDAIKSEMATFFTVFPGGTVWSNDLLGMGYDVVMLAKAGEMKINVDDLQLRLDRDDHRLVAQSLKEMGFSSAVELLGTFAGHGPDLKSWLKDVEINRDLNLRLQYLAGMGLNSQLGQGIFQDLLTHFRFPEGLFIASESRRQALRKAFGLDK